MKEENIGRKIMFVLIALFVIIAAVIFVSRWRSREVKRPGTVREVPGEIRTVTLFFGNSTADGLVSETRDITSEGGFENEVKQVIEALLEGPEKGGRVSAIPRGTKIERVFRVEDKKTVYLDFSRDLISNHEGGSAGEYYTIKMILKTIGVNFPQVARVQFLVGGYPVDTIAGHYKVDSPLSVREWR
ncbi:MAG: GerMN domain-containing protein [Candidatus Krumholzibacteriota bacterium]|nr:GerMN domain-containing protein [Candidatus Krumholzibacteriota bacterium]